MPPLPVSIFFFTSRKGVGRNLSFREAIRVLMSVRMSRPAKEVHFALLQSAVTPVGLRQRSTMPVILAGYPSVTFSAVTVLPVITEI